MPVVLDPPDEGFLAPPRPLDEERRSLPLGVRVVIFMFLVAALVVALVIAGGRTPSVDNAEDIATVYDHAIVLQSRDGDSLETASLAVFPNTLIEERVRDDKLDDEAKALELARYQAEWQRLARLLTGTTGTTLSPGEYFAVPAKADEPGAMEVSRVSAEIQRRTEQAQPAGD